MKLFNDKCENVIDQINEDFVLLSDPPYGLGDNCWKRKFHGTGGKTRLSGKTQDWDSTINEDAVTMFRKKAVGSVIFGGNFYDLPSSRCWFVWDKLQSNRGADCELAWTDLDLAPKVFRMSRIEAYSNKALFKKEHPAEKPVQLFEFCLEHIGKLYDLNKITIVDPFMGSGNCGVACKIHGVNFIGIEQKKEFFDIAWERNNTPTLEKYM